jgi:hypothetical protein
VTTGCTLVGVRLVVLCAFALAVAACASSSSTALSAGTGTSGSAGTVGTGSGSAGTGTVGAGTVVTGGVVPSSPPSSTVTTRPAPPPPTVAPQPAPGTGIYGSVTAGPTCPVERPDQPCPPRPVAAEIDAAGSDGVTVGSTHTDGNGNYRMTIAPGTYTVSAATGSTYPRCPSKSGVVVANGSATRADISCDTGIR